MKRFIGLLLCLLLMAGCMSVPNADKGEHEEVVVVETKKIEYLTDSDLSRLYTCKEDKRNETTISFTVEEAQMLMKLAQCEAGGCVTSQYLEMMVVVNRLNSDEFPDTLKEVIFQDGQFAVVEEGKFSKAEPTIESHLALAMVEKGIDFSEGAIWVESSSNSDNSWHSQNKTFLYERYGQRYYK